MSSKISESIFDNGEVVVAMADVQHIEYQKHPTIGANGIMVITKHSRWNNEADCWANAIYISEAKKQEFIKSWCIYRSESEQVSTDVNKQKIAAMCMQGLLSKYSLKDPEDKITLAKLSIELADTLVSQFELQSV